MGEIVTPLWQLSPRAADGTYPRHRALPNIPTFEEVYAKIHPGKTLPVNLAYDAMRTIQDAQLATFRIAMMPPKASPEALKILRAAFDQLWTDEKFLKAYAKSVHTQPTPVKGAQAQEILGQSHLHRSERSAISWPITPTTSSRRNRRRKHRKTPAGADLSEVGAAFRCRHAACRRAE